MFEKIRKQIIKNKAHVIVGKDANSSKKTKQTQL